MVIDFKQTKLQLVGIVTLGDVVQQIIVEQKFTIRELEKYITGGYER
jgi:IMP dehydrogenase